MKHKTEHQKSARILIVDDERSSAELLSRLLQKSGYPICITVTDPLVAIERFELINPDLVLLDLHMQPLSGIEVLAKIDRIVSPQSRPPILVITGDTSLEAKYEALQAGATDFLSKPLDFLEVQLRIKHLLETRNLFQRCQSYSHQLEALVSERTAELQQQARSLEMTIEELKRTQQQIIQQERLRALGAMASGIAHDLNNGLSLILGYGDLLLTNTSKFPPRSEEHRFLEHMVRAGRDNAELVERLRNFYRPCDAREERQDVDLNKLIEEAASLTAPRWEVQAEAKGATISIQTELGNIPRIAGSPSELREVLINLIFNSVDAMPSGGQIRIVTRLENGQVRMEFSDTGVGMTEEARQRCLEPFFTTKGEAGSGLGLAMSYGIIRRHGGTIGVTSKRHHGTTFVIELPTFEGRLTSSEAPAEEPVRGLRILVVDDHPSICDVLGGYLAVDGHTVATASSGRDGLDRFCNEHFDVVFTDRAMPDISGHELAAAIKRINPNEPIIMLTGLADIVNVDDESLDDVDLVISKPAALADLRGAIQKVIPKDRKAAKQGAVSTVV